MPARAKHALDAVGAAAVGDQRHAADLGQRRHDSALGQRRPLRHEEEVGIAYQLDVLERALRRDDREREIEPSAFDEVEQHVIPRGLVEPDLDSRALLDQPAHGVGQHADRHALEGADPQRVGRALGERRELGLGRLELGREARCVAQHAGARVGRHHGLAPARALEEPGACRALEGGDLQADRRLRVAELLGRTGERPRGDDGLERHQVPHLDPEQSMSLFHHHGHEL